MKQSEHARRRCAQRNIETVAMEMARQYGRVVHRTGVVFYFLGRRDIPVSLRQHEGCRRMEGTTVVAAGDGEVITVYRNPAGLRKIKKKAKCRLPR